MKDPNNAGQHQGYLWMATERPRRKREIKSECEKELNYLAANPFLSPPDGIAVLLGISIKRQRDLRTILSNSDRTANLLFLEPKWHRSISKDPRGSELLEILAIDHHIELLREFRRHEPQFRNAGEYKACGPEHHYPTALYFTFAARLAQGDPFGCRGIHIIRNNPLLNRLRDANHIGKPDCEQLMGATSSHPTSLNHDFRLAFKAMGPSANTKDLIDFLVEQGQLGTRLCFIGLEKENGKTYIRSHAAGEDVMPTSRTSRDTLSKRWRRYKNEGRKKS